MTEALVTPSLHQVKPAEVAEHPVALALLGAAMAVERGGLAIPAGIEAELQSVFGVDWSAPAYPLAAHALDCDWIGNRHRYLLPFHKTVEE